jgi:hypothetical protein
MIKYTLREEKGLVVHITTGEYIDNNYWHLFKNIDKENRDLGNLKYPKNFRLIAAEWIDTEDKSTKNSEWEEK